MAEISKIANRDVRAAQKRASRGNDARRLQQGESAAVLQQENSVFGKGSFAGARISNLSAAVGK